MKLMTCIIFDFHTQMINTQKGQRTKYVFEAHETDLNGARIPVELHTFNDKISNAIQPHVKSNEQVYVPFDNITEFNGKSQVNVSSLITHPDFVLSV